VEHFPGTCRCRSFYNPFPPKFVLANWKFISIMQDMKIGRSYQIINFKTLLSERVPEHWKIARMTLSPTAYERREASYEEGDNPWHAEG